MKQESKIAVLETEAKILEGGDEQELELPSGHIDKRETVKRYVQNLDVDEPIICANVMYDN